MVEKFLDKVHFRSYEDFMENFKVNVPDNFNFAYDVVDSWAVRQPDKSAILWTNEKGIEKIITFWELKKITDTTASFFSSLGISQGDRVLLVLKRRIEFWYSIIALHKLGAVTIPATHLLTPKDIEYRCNKAKIKMIVAVGEENVINNIEEALPNSPTVEQLVSTGPIVPNCWHGFSEGIKNAKPFVKPWFVNRNKDVMLIYFTSGTTGEPKMVAHDFTYPLGHIITGYIWHNLNENSRHLTIADTGWGKAAWGKLYGQWIAGAEVMVYDFDKFIPADILSVLERYSVTSLCAPPTIFRFMIKEDVRKYNLSALKYCTIAGEALNPAVFEQWKALTGIELMEGFGQTETTLTIATYPWVKPRPGSMGKAGPQYDIEVVDDYGKPVKAGEEGEIVINLKKGRPLGLFKEYLDDPELTKEAVRNSRYHTGDMAVKDEDGYLWFVGRKDDVIKTSGYRVGPFEVESALMTHPAVVECAVTGEPDEIRGQIIKATIVVGKFWKETDKATLAKEIQDHVKKTTAPYKYPRKIEFVDELPKTISGKIRRIELRS